MVSLQILLVHMKDDERQIPCYRDLRSVAHYNGQPLCLYDDDPAYPLNGHLQAPFPSRGRNECLVPNYPRNECLHSPFSGIDVALSPTFSAIISHTSKSSKSKSAKSAKIRKICKNCKSAKNLQKMRTNQ